MLVIKTKLRRGKFLLLKKFSGGKKPKYTYVQILILQLLKNFLNVKRVCVFVLHLAVAAVAKTFSSHFARTTTIVFLTLIKMMNTPFNLERQPVS